MEYLSKKIKFSDISEMLEKISASSNKKEETLKKYFCSFDKFRTDFIEKNGANSESSLFPVLRLLLPNADRERTSYGLKTKTLRDMYINILEISAQSKEAKSLQKYEDNTDLADKLYEILKLRSNLLVGEFTVFEVNQHLDAISEHYQNNRKRIQDELTMMKHGMSALEQKWLIRIILKNLRLGIGQHKILSLYHTLANDLYDMHSNLSKVCQCCESNEQITINKHSVELFNPIKPMLCQRVNFKLVENLIKNKDFYLETKMDGERFHIHRDGDIYRYYSRHGADYTSQFNATLSSFLDKLFLIPITNLILDGEMMVWDKEELMYRDKSENTDVKSIKADNPVVRPCFVAYDVLYLNGKSMLTKPYAERIRLLDTLVNEHVGIFQKCPRMKIKDSEHIIECLNKAIDDKEEGVVIKEQDSVYKPNERNAGWYKIKPDYIDNLISDFDLVIVGGFYKKGKTTINSFLVAIYDPIQEVYIAVTKVGIGLSADKWKNLNATLEPHWNKVNFKKEGRTTIRIEPKNIRWGEHPPNVWIEPSNSIVLELKASEIVKSGSFASNYTLRFPRITSIRSDKICTDSCTKLEFDNLCDSSSKVSKLAKRHVTNSDLVGEAPKTKLRKRTKISPVELCRLNSDEKELEKIDDICQGLDFYISSKQKGNPTTVEEMEKLVLRHGGRVVKNPGPKTFVIIAGEVKFIVAKMAVSKNYNIAKVDWLLKALGGEQKRQKLLEFSPNDMIATTDALENEMAQNFDRFGDSFTQEINVGEFVGFLKGMELEKYYFPTQKEVVEGENEILLENKKLFRGIKASFYEENLSKFIEKSRLKLMKLKFQDEEGQIDEKDPKYIFVIKNSALKIENSKFLNIDWIQACLRARNLTETNQFINF